MWVVPSDRDRTYFRQNCSQEFLAGYLAAYRVEFRGQPGRSCGPWWRSSCRLWPRPSTWSRVECAWSTAPSRRAGPMPRTTSCGAASTAPPGSTPNWSACSTAPPSTSPTRCRDAPTMQKAFRHHAGRRDCRALRWRDRGLRRRGISDGEATYCVLRRNVEHSELGCVWLPMPTNVSQMAGRSRTSTGQNATMLLLRGGVAVDRWERLRGGAFGFGLYKERSSFGPTPWTSDPRADQHVEQVWFAGVHSDVGGGYPDPALAEIALLWMADRARERGLVLQADAFPASPENATQAPQDRMALRRSQPAGNAAPIPHGLGSPAHPGAGHGRRQVRRPSRVRPSRESAAVEVYQKPHSLLRVDEEKAGRQLGGASGAPRTTPEYEIPATRPGQQARARAV